MRYHPVTKFLTISRTYAWQGENYLRNLKQQTNSNFWNKQTGQILYYLKTESISENIKF